MHASNFSIESPALADHVEMENVIRSTDIAGGWSCAMVEPESRPSEGKGPCQAYT